LLNMKRTSRNKMYFKITASYPILEEYQYSWPSSKESPVEIRAAL